MGKIVFWIVVFFLVLLALRLLSVHQTRRERREAQERQDGDSARKADATSEVMVRCENCGVFLPKSTAVLSAKGASCGDRNCKHRR